MKKSQRKLKDIKIFAKTAKIWVDIGVTATTYYFEYYLGFADIENNECALEKGDETHEVNY